MIPRQDLLIGKRRPRRPRRRLSKAVRRQLLIAASQLTVGTNSAGPKGARFIVGAKRAIPDKAGRSRRQRAWLPGSLNGSTGSTERNRLCRQEFVCARIADRMSRCCMTQRYFRVDNSAEQNSPHGCRSIVIQTDMARSSITSKAKRRSESIWRWLADLSYSLFYSSKESTRLPAIVLVGTSFCPLCTYD